MLVISNFFNLMVIFGEAVSSSSITNSGVEPSDSVCSHVQLFAHGLFSFVCSLATLVVIASGNTCCSIFLFVWFFCDRS